MYTYVPCKDCQKLNRVEIQTGKTAHCGACKADLPLHGSLVEGFDHTLEVLLKKSPLPVVIDVWAPWCAPCRAFAGSFQRASDFFAGKAVFCKINSDQNPASAIKLNIRGIPALFVFRDGQELGRLAGAPQEEDFKGWVQNLIRI